MRTNISIKHTSPADLAKALRSAAAKIDAEAIVPGASIVQGNVRITVAESQESDIRAFARAKGIEVGTRGRFSKSLLEEFAKHQARSENARKAAAARQAKREAEAVPVEA